MNSCPKCGKLLNREYNYCEDCGVKTVKNNAFNYIEVGLSIFPIFIAVFGVIILCILSASNPSTDGSVTGLYIIFGIPIGLLLCIPQFILPAISFLNFTKRAIYKSVIELVLCTISIITFLIFIKEFTDVNSVSTIFFIINTVILSTIALFVIINLIIYCARKNK